MTTRRERIRNETIEEIKATAWRQIAETGASGLSLRWIAREMGMTAPGLYRYFKDRDALVTALLMEAFDSFALALESARDAAPNDSVERFRQMSRAYFGWGSENPQKYNLLFGSPIHGYVFAEELIPTAQKSFFVLLGILAQAHAAGKLSGTAISLQMPAALTLQYAGLAKQGFPYPDIVIQSALSAWGLIHGITSLYLQNYLNGILQTAVGAFVEHEIEKMLQLLGME